METPTSHVKGLTLACDVDLSTVTDGQGQVYDELHNQRTLQVNFNTNFGDAFAEVSLAAPLLVAYETEERATDDPSRDDDDDDDGEQLLVVVPAEVEGRR